MLSVRRRSLKRKALAHRLCNDLLAQARDDNFFLRLGVPDSMDGRFDLVVLHAWIVLERIQSDPPLAQAVVNEIFVNFDEALRHLGTGDAGMSRRLKTMASAFYGRLRVYRESETVEALAAAVHRNLYRKAEGHERNAIAVATYAWEGRSRSSHVDIGTMEWPVLGTCE